MPAEFGPWQAIYDAFARWRDAGMLAALVDATIAEAGRRGQADLSLVSLDSTSVRAHQDATGMQVYRLLVIDRVPSACHILMMHAIAAA